MNQFNNQFKKGILPPQLNYTLENNILDYSKLQYNSRYQSYEFYAGKFPPQWKDEKLFEPIIQMITNKAKLNNMSPLDELNNILNNNIDNNVISNSPQ